MSDLLITTTETIAGREIAEIIGLVRGNTVRARHIGRDILAGLRSIVGGDVPEYRKLMAESREQALDQLAEEAAALGADAVVGVRMTTSMIGAGLAELMVYGTAVKLV